MRSSARLYPEGSSSSSKKATLSSSSTSSKSKAVFTLRDFTTLGDVLKEGGKLREAEDLYLSGLQGREKALGRDHPETLSTAHNLALIYEAQRKFSEAEDLYKVTLAARERLFGREHPAPCCTAFCLGDMLRKLDRRVEARQYLVYAHNGFLQTLGKEHKNTRLCAKIIRNLDAQPTYSCCVA